MNAPARVVIATRKSPLALWQAEHVRGRLLASGDAAVELLPMTTRGDQILDRSLAKVGGKGLFVKELETAIDDGRAHLAVHSLKDVPMSLPPGLSERSAAASPSSSSSSSPFTWIRIAWKVRVAGSVFWPRRKPAARRTMAASSLVRSIGRPATIALAMVRARGSSP